MKRKRGRPTIHRQPSDQIAVRVAPDERERIKRLLSTRRRAEVLLDECDRIEQATPTAGEEQAQ